jgi:hypothetical protein
MPTNQLRRIRLDAAAAEAAPEPAPWLWDGYLMPGDVTLLTSRWKTGKTTLLAGLLRHLGTGDPFLDRPVRPGRAWVVSEESEDLWAERVRRRPVGPHVELLARPFRGRPTPADWADLIAQAAAARAAGELDLFVVDPLASFLPSRSESEPTTLLDALFPLHRLTTAGVAVLLLHHPRKRAAEPGSTARGGGALLGFVDRTVELTRYGKMPSDAHRRQLFAQSRRAGGVARLAYEWDATADAFRAVPDPRERQFEDNWQTVLAVLTPRTAALTTTEIRQFWPDDAERPSESTLYDWLSRAHARKMVRREGRGTRHSPWKYRLENEDDKYYDRGELPPLRWHDLGPPAGDR